MCLAVPAKIVEIDGTRARIDMAGNVREADLTLLPDAKLGEYVLVHAGFAIGKVAPEEAKDTFKALEELREASKTKN